MAWEIPAKGSSSEMKLWVLNFALRKVVQREINSRDGGEHDFKAFGEGIFLLHMSHLNGR